MKLIINNLFYKRLFVFNGEKIEKSEKKNTKNILPIILIALFF